MLKLLLLFNLALLVSGQPDQLTSELRDNFNQQWESYSKDVAKSIYNFAMRLWKTLQNDYFYYVWTNRWTSDNWPESDEGEWKWEQLSYSTRLIDKSWSGVFTFRTSDDVEYSFDRVNVARGYRSMSYIGDDVLAYLHYPTLLKGKHINGTIWDENFYIKFDNGEEGWVGHELVFKFVPY